MFTGANHVCVVTGDLDRSIRSWADRYGVGPWSVWTKDASNMDSTVEGRPTEFAMRVALCSLSPTFRLELIQPLDDRSPYAGSLARHGGADHVHHLRLDVADYDTARERLVGLGNDVLFDASFDGATASDGRVRATYFTTGDELGFTLEIADLPAGFAMPEPERVHPTPQEVRP